MKDLNSILIEGCIADIEPEYASDNQSVIYNLTNETMMRKDTFMVIVPIRAMGVVDIKDEGRIYRIVGRVMNIAGSIYVRAEHIEKTPNKREQ